ncbi:hypothetical protein Patl1_24087 [Pistacia atlantica]|uniref:Uncharacterized protein n=1 Tax=Pistacia atlantica TaxID=434234 RepID=A0ACC0ZYK5_9ROSI|nr:hypothetical protein Patl1_24087 [Pistacia atlantica]
MLCFTNIQRMLEGHPGFDCVSTNMREYLSIEYMMLCPWNLLQGGTLWFQSLTEFPHGLLGPIFPIVID